MATLQSEVEKAFYLYDSGQSLELYRDADNNVQIGIEGMQEFQAMSRKERREQPARITPQEGFQRFGEAMGGAIAGAVPGAVAGSIGAPGDIAALFKGAYDAATAEEGQRLDAFLNTVTEISEQYGSERALKLIRDTADVLPVSDQVKEGIKAGAETGSFVGIGGTATAAGKAALRGAKEYAAGAPARVAERGVGTTLRSGFDPTEIIDEGLAKLAPNKIVKLDAQKNKKQEKPRDESSGHAADYVPAQFGPPAHKMNLQTDEEFTPDGYGTFSANVGNDYQNLKFFISSVRGSKEFDEEVAFYRKLFAIKDNPDAEITVYRASPTNDLRYGDIVTPIKSDADYHVEQSEITRDDIIKAERKARVESDKPVDLKQEKAIRAMDSIMELFPDDTTPSKVFTYKVKAKDIRWDGNNGLIRWGYFPEGKVETISKVKKDD